MVSATSRCEHAMLQHSPRFCSYLLCVHGVVRHVSPVLCVRRGQPCAVPPRTELWSDLARLLHSAAGRRAAAFPHPVQNKHSRPAQQYNNAAFQSNNAGVDQGDTGFGQGNTGIGQGGTDIGQSGSEGGGGSQS